MVKYNDQELLEIYQKVIAGETDSTSQTPEELTGEDKELYDSINKMTGSQVRDLLKNSGFDQEIIDKYNDQQLKQLLLEALIQE